MRLRPKTSPNEPEVMITADVLALTTRVEMQVAANTPTVRWAGCTATSLTRQTVGPAGSRFLPVPSEWLRRHPATLSRSASSYRHQDRVRGGSVPRMTPVRTALYLDFDNVFSGLTKLDPEAAVLFAQNPTAWLDQLAETLTVEGPRRWLILRCYMNPSGWVPRPSSSERQYFSQFRQSFTSAGFEVIDCPRLAHTKNAADIRLVVDALDALTGQVRYDEFIVASGDSDMTPLLVRLRADDRRVTLLSPFDAVEALAAVADRLINGQQLLELLQGEEEAPGDIARFGEIVRRRFVAATEPINLSALAQQVRQEMGVDVKASGWFGAGSFAGAIAGLALPNAESAVITCGTGRGTRRHPRRPCRRLSLCPPGCPLRSPGSRVRSGCPDSSRPRGPRLPRSSRSTPAATTSR